MKILDGYTATRRIRELEKERSQSVTIIALTANALLEDRQRSLDAGCKGHLPKPISKDKLIAAIKSYRSQADMAEALTASIEEPGQRFAFRIPPGFEPSSRKYIRKQLDGIAQIRCALADGRLDELQTAGHQMKGTL